ncbi:MAG: AAA family ATPase, partial [Synergistaceae bacterium]|nr:AAA family ATPase [Synergistaceae bacterium]
LMEIEPSAVREVFVEIPDVSWQDIGGLEDIKQELIQAVTWPLAHAKLFEKFKIQPVKGILLHGKSGTGKTLLAKALAKESGVNFISVQSSSIISRFMGESERALREVFKVARQAAPSILYFDEIDALISARGKGANNFSSTEDRLAAQFMSEMNGIEELTGVVVLATTNRVDLLDPALLAAGRFDLVLELPLPDAKAREEIFKIELANKQLAKDVDLKFLARKTENMSGAEIAKICRSAAMRALKFAVNNNTEDILIKPEYFEI